MRMTHRSFDRPLQDPPSMSRLAWQALVWGISAGATFYGLQHTKEHGRPSSLIDRLAALARRRWTARHLVEAVLKASDTTRLPAVVWLALLGSLVEYRRSKSSVLAVSLWLGYCLTLVDENDEESPPHPTDLPQRIERLLQDPTSSDLHLHDTSATEGRHVELLVHNVSHTDLVLGLQSDFGFESYIDVAAPLSPTTKSDDYCLARPRFSCFEKYSRMVEDALSPQGNDEILSFPRYRREPASPRFSIRQAPTDESTAAGLALTTPIAGVDAGEVRVRGRDQARLPERLLIGQVFFPLLATLYPRWLERIADKQYQKPVKRVVILVSGVGTPRNWTHDVRGNSTQVCARLMQAFLQRLDPSLTIVHIHSTTNLFRYDENLVFAENELMPVINAYRDAHARGLSYPDEEPQVIEHVDWAQHAFSAEWRKSFHTTLSFADGSPARTYAIQASLRPYRPTYFHFWQLKTFWHESKIVNDDIEVHSFEAMETIPAVDASRCTDPGIVKVIAEMKAFRATMTETLAGNDHDIVRFWLRKTHKPVLAVLLVQSSDMAEPVLYRGTNMEVSMPTGSLCAERNVIGSALADRPNLKREDLKLIAVLAVPFDKDASRPTPISTDASSLASDRPVDQSDQDWVLSTTSEEAKPVAGGVTIDDLSLSDRSGRKESMGDYSTSSTPVRHIDLVTKCSPAPRATRTVFLPSTPCGHDMNPLRPCGACNEWLKKIAESNPYFKIVTFTDADCNGVYINPCVT